MTLQISESRSLAIADRFDTMKEAEPHRLISRLNLSWSNWVFGSEPLATSVARLSRNGVSYIELHGNLYGADQGYRASEVGPILADHGMSVSGVCGMFSTDNDLSSRVASERQRGIDYIRRQVNFTREVGGGYLLIVPGAVGRPVAYDSLELDRSAESLTAVAQVFVENDVKGAVEPIRADEVSLVHTVSDAQSFIELIGHPGIAHINGDIFHMQASETHVGEAILSAGAQLVNLHMADSNRRALGAGQMDIDTVIRALYLIGHNIPGRYVTPEPLGPGASPYECMWGTPDRRVMDELVGDTVQYFRERERAVRGEA